MEANTLSRWAARTPDPHVYRVLVCDGGENYLISRSAQKSDKADAYSLCRLLRPGELKEVYHAEEDRRSVFITTAQHYLDCRARQVALKQKIKAKFRQWGILDFEGEGLYSEDGREVYLERLSQSEVSNQLHRLYLLLDEALQAWSEAKSQMLRLGEQYPEIEDFQEVSGVSSVGAHLFNAIIQTPHRFSTKQKLWSCCQLGVRSQTSDGKLLGYKELDPNGRGELKAVSYRARVAFLRHGDNEVARFFEQSLERAGDRTNARLNTQRKILATLLALWKNNSSYRPKRSLGSA